MTKHFFSEDDINDFIKRYQSGESTKSIADSIGVTGKVITRILTSSGIEVRSKRYHRLGAEVERAIIDCFLSGVGIGGVAGHLGLEISHNVVSRIIRQAGVATRNRSEQQLMRMARSTPEQIAQLTAAAHKASKGRKATEEELIKRAKTIAALPAGSVDASCAKGAATRSGRICSKREVVVLDAIRKHGLDPIPGAAIWKYNIDLLVGSVAVEVFGGGWSFSDKKRIARYVERTKKLGELGYHTLVVVTGERFMPVDGGHLVAAINELNGDPAASRQYRVIWGCKDGLAGSCDDFNESALVCPFVNVRDSATGRYISVPRETV